MSSSLQCLKYNRIAHSVCIWETTMASAPQLALHRHSIKSSVRFLGKTGTRLVPINDERNPDSSPPNRLSADITKHLIAIFAFPPVSANLAPSIAHFASDCSLSCRSMRMARSMSIRTSAYGFFLDLTSSKEAAKIPLTLESPSSRRQMEYADDNDSVDIPERASNHPCCGYSCEIQWPPASDAAITIPSSSFDKVSICSSVRSGDFPIPNDISPNSLHLLSTSFHVLLPASRMLIPISPTEKQECFSCSSLKTSLRLYRSPVMNDSLHFRLLPEVAFAF
mmetsp:Transcript_36587/g.82470  ORF Transcript_36587/g.82470 Transcript_36587/m.82470 type:complete len:280 (+) Transcript_36587:202-1041(+)